MNIKKNIRFILILSIVMASLVFVKKEVSAANVVDSGWYRCGYIKWTVYDDGKMIFRISERDKSEDTSAKLHTDYASFVKYIEIPEGFAEISGFKGFTNLISINIPDSVTSIDRGAFAGCTSLASIEIPESVTGIESYVFYGCTSLASIKIPESLTSIDSYAFYYCISLASIEIPESVTGIGESAFEGCTSLTGITIPNSVKTIGSSAFKECTNLTSITILNPNIDVGSEVFRGCKNIEYVEMPESLMKRIDIYEVFAGTKWLKKYKLREYPIGKVFDDGTFRYKITSHNIDPKKKTYGEVSIVGRTKSKKKNNSSVLINGVWDDNLKFNITSIDQYAFKNDKYMTYVYIDSEHLRKIPKGAFKNCKKLQSFTIYGSSLDSIDKEAFANCSDLNSVTVGENSGLATIGNSAFKGCIKLRDVQIHSLKLTTIKKDAFGKCGGKGKFISISIASKNLREVGKNSIPDYATVSVYKPLIKKYQKILKKAGYRKKLTVGWTKKEWKSDFSEYE